MRYALRYSLFFSDEIAVQLSHYLLSTLCTDLFNAVLIFLAEDNGVALPLESKVIAKVI